MLAKSNSLLDWMTGTIRRLSHIKRFSSFPVNRQENVSEHSFWVSTYAYIIALDFIEKGIEVDCSKVCLKATLHDWEESMTGDIIRSFKYKSKKFREQSKEIENALVTESLLMGLSHNVKKKIFKEWTTSKDLSIEGRIVAFCDLLSVVAYCDEELRLGNVHLKHIKEDTKKYFDEFLETIKDAKHKQIFSEIIGGIYYG